MFEVNLSVNLKTNSYDVSSFYQEKDPCDAIKFLRTKGNKSLDLNFQSKQSQRVFSIYDPDFATASRCPSSLSLVTPTSRRT